MIRLDIDLQVEQASPDGGPPTRFSVRAEGQEVVVSLESTPGLGSMSRRDLTQLVPLADGLARRGIRVRVEGPRGTLVQFGDCLLYTSPSPRDRQKSRMPSSA